MMIISDSSEHINDCDSNNVWKIQTHREITCLDHDDPSQNLDDRRVLGRDDDRDRDHGRLSANDWKKIRDIAKTWTDK